jgi:carbamoyltransferase
MIILGINAYHADSSAAIFVDGKMIAAIEEERFRRVKHWAGFPDQAIAFCLQEAGVGFEDVDYFSIGRDPRAKFWNKLKYLAAHPFGNVSVILDRLSNSKKAATIEQELARLSGISASEFRQKTLNIEHHRSHIASAFFASPFDEAACLSVDGSGDFSTTMTASGKGNKFEVLNSVDFPHSIGLLYTAFTQLLGFPHYGDEYKVMGMAPYGKPVYTEQLKKVIQFTSNGFFKLDLSYFRKATSGVISYGSDHTPVVAPLFSEKMEKSFGPARKKEEPLSDYHKDLAASVQRITELALFHLLEHLHIKTGMTNVCIAGGVAQNSVANGKITANSAFKNVYIPSAGHDAGISMGAALYAQHQINGLPRQSPVFSAYTGSRYSNEEIKHLLKQRNVEFEELDENELYDRVAEKLMDAGVIGWFCGRAEFGPRALGGRSIIADPRRTDAKEILNAKIKRRESFRPFAPSVLKEYVNEYFECHEPVPFMEKVFPVRPEKRGMIPAVTHVDGSGRLQSVDSEVSPRYYRLIDTFRKKTGVPILLNTSFNENEPIVNHPEEALNCFLRTSMDMLVMENIVVTRK